MLFRQFPWGLHRLWQTRKFCWLIPVTKTAWGPPGLATSHAPERLLALVSESADRDLLHVHSQQSFQTTTQLVELGTSVEFSDTQSAHFGRADDRLSGNIIPKHTG